MYFDLRLPVMTALLSYHSLRKNTTPHQKTPCLKTGVPEAAKRLGKQRPWNNSVYAVTSAFCFAIKTENFR
jgi:hypothetical protein